MGVFFLIRYSLVVEQLLEPAWGAGVRGQERGVPAHTLCSVWGEGRGRRPPAPARRNVAGRGRPAGTPPAGTSVIKAHRGHRLRQAAGGEASAGIGEGHRCGAWRRGAGRGQGVRGMAHPGERSVGVAAADCGAHRPESGRQRTNVALGSFLWAMGRRFRTMAGRPHGLDLRSRPKPAEGARSQSSGS